MHGCIGVRTLHTHAQGGGNVGARLIRPIDLPTGIGADHMQPGKHDLDSCPLLSLERLHMHLVGSLIIPPD